VQSKFPAIGELRADIYEKREARSFLGGAGGGGNQSTRGWVTGPKGLSCGCAVCLQSLMFAGEKRRGNRVGLSHMGIHCIEEGKALS